MAVRFLEKKKVFIDMCNQKGRDFSDLGGGSAPCSREPRQCLEVLDSRQGGMTDRGCGREDHHRPTVPVLFNNTPERRPIGAQRCSNVKDEGRLYSQCENE